MFKIKPLYLEDASAEAGSAPAASTEGGEQQTASDPNAGEGTPPKTENFFSQFSNDFDSLSESDPEPVEPAAEPNATPAEPAASEGTSADTEPEPVADPPPAEPVSQQEPAQQPAEQTPTQPVEPQLSAEEQQAQALEKYNADVKALTDFYALNEEEAALLESNPAEALPQLAAKMHYQVINSAVSAIWQSLPQYIMQTMQHVEATREFENSFYDKWSQIDRAKHAEEVNKIATLYMQQNQGASREQFLDEVGLMALMKLGLHQQQQAPENQGKPPVNNQQQSQLPPNNPGGARTTTGSQQKTDTSDGNFYSELSKEFELED